VKTGWNLSESFKEGCASKRGCFATDNEDDDDDDNLFLGLVNVALLFL
jgi:hypothetical protein